jgi:hypothetical protein
VTRFLQPLEQPASGQASLEGSCQAPIRSRSTVSGRRRRHNAGKPALGRQPICSASPMRMRSGPRT